MARVSIVADSASDLSPASAAAAGITIVPLIVRFGDQEFEAGVDLSADAFWEKMLAPGAPLPTTAAASAGTFKEAFERLFQAGTDEIVCVTVGSKISATFKSASIARDLLPGRTIEVVDSASASMGIGLLAILAAEMAADDADADAATIAAALRARVPDLDLYVALDTLDYLRRSGRISGTRAAVGGLLSVKPIIAIRDGEVLQIERVRTRTKARARVVELFAQAPVERVALLGGPGTEVEKLRADLLRRLPDLDPSAVLVETVGSSIGPHIGPGFAGGIVLRRR